MVNKGQDKSHVYSGVSAGMHRARATKSGLPEVGMEVKLNAAGSRDSCTSGGADVGVEGPKCWSLDSWPAGNASVVQLLTCMWYDSGHRLVVLGSCLCWA